MAMGIKKRRGRPAIKPYIDELIRREILMEQGQPPERRLPVNVLADQIQRRLIKKKEKSIPQLSTLEKYISFYRSTTSLDEPWSLGESIKPEYDIPADATGILLELWKYSLEIGYPFTLRHARWIARLHRVIVTANNGADHWKQIQILFFTALQYADKERVFEKLLHAQHRSQADKEKEKARFDTTAEDTDLMISPGEAVMLQESGILPLTRLSEIPENINEMFKEEEGKEREIRTKTENLYNILRTKPNVAVVVHVLHRPRSINKYESVEDKLSNLMKLWGRCTEIEDVIGTLSVEQQRAYAILVTCFSKLPQWDDLSVQDYLDIIGKFAELVSQYSKLDQLLCSVFFDKKKRDNFIAAFEKVGLSSHEDISALDKMLGVLEVTNRNEAKK